MSLQNTRKQNAVANSGLDHNMAKQSGTERADSNAIVDITVEDGALKTTKEDGTTSTISIEPKVSPVINVSNSRANESSIEDGGIYNPYKSITGAISGKTNTVVKIYPGTYNEALAFSPTNLTIGSDSDESAYRVKIVGGVLIQSPVSTSISNIEIDGDLIINMQAEESGRRASLLYLNNIAVTGDVIIAGNGGYVQFDRNCEFSRNMEISGNVSARLISSQFEGESNLLNIDTTGTVELFNMLYVTLNKKGGNVVAAGGTIFQLRTISGTVSPGVVCEENYTGSFIAFDALCMDETLTYPSYITIADGQVFSPCNFVYERQSSSIAGEIVPINGRGTSVLIPDKFVDGEFNNITWADMQGLLNNYILGNVPILSVPSKYMVNFVVSGSSLTTIICQYIYEEISGETVTRWVVSLSSSGAGVAKTVRKINSGTVINSFSN